VERTGTPIGARAWHGAPVTGTIRPLVVQGPPIAECRVIVSRAGAMLRHAHPRSPMSRSSHSSSSEPPPPLPRRRVVAIAGWVLIAAVAVGTSLRPAPLPAEMLADVPAATATASAAGDAFARVALSSDSGIRTVDWRLLASLDPRTGDVPAAVRALDGQRVRVPGFVVPLEDFMEQAKEFLLVPWFGACVHTPPPPPNQMVFVALRGSQRLASLWDPVWIEGVLEIKRVQSPYGAVSYRMRGERIVPYRSAR
jgi:hypothetical protein